VRPVSAVINPDNGGFSWDDFSDPDPELGLWCPATAGSLSAIMTKVSDSLTPTWNSGGCTTTAAELLADGFAFDAIDIDPLGGYEVIASKTTVPVTQSNLRAGTMSCSAFSITSMTVQLTKQ